MMFYFYSCCKVRFVKDSSFCLWNLTVLHNLGHPLRLGSCLGGPFVCTWQVLGTSSVQWAGIKSSQLIQNDFCKASEVDTFKSGSLLFCPIPWRLNVIKSNLDSKEYNKAFQKKMTVIERESLSKLHLKWKVWLAQLAPRQKADDDGMTEEYLLSLRHLRVAVSTALS